MPASQTTVDPIEPPDRRALAGALLLVGGAVAVVLAWAPSELFDLERYLVPKALALHLVALGLLLLGPAPRRPREWGRTGRLLALFVGWSALSTAFATNRWLALAGWGVSFSSAVVLLSAQALPERVRWRTLGGVLAAVVLGAGLGVAQAYGFHPGWLSDSRPPGGTFGNRNFLGHLAAIAAPSALMAALCARRKATSALALAGLGVLAAVVVLTRSRAAWLGGMVGIAVAVIGLWWVARRSRSGLRAGRLLVGGAVAAAAIALAVLVPNDLDWVADSPYAATLGGLADFQQGSGRGRLIQYGNSLRLVPRDPIFGTGPGNWFVAYPTVTQSGDPAYAGADLIPTNPWPSSDWVALLVERGTVGALLLLLAGGAAVAAMLGSAESAADRRFAAGAVAGTLAAALVCGAFDAVLLLAAPSFLTWAVVGLLLPARPAPPMVADPFRWPGRAATALAVVLVLYTAAHTAAIALTADDTSTRVLATATRFAPGEHRLRLVLAQRGRCDHAIRAARLMPNHARVARLAARCG